MILYQAFNGSMDLTFESYLEAHEYLTRLGYANSGETACNAGAKDITENSADNEGTDYYYSLNEFDPENDNVQHYIGDGSYCPQITARKVKY